MDAKNEQIGRTVFSFIKNIPYIYHKKQDMLAERRENLLVPPNEKKSYNWMSSLSIILSVKRKLFVFKWKNSDQILSVDEHLLSSLTETEVGSN